MFKIKNLKIKIIKTFPSSLDTIDYWMIVYEATDFSDDWFKEHEYEVAEEIYDESFSQNIFIVHATSTRGEAISELLKDSFFATTRINCDSVLDYHIIGAELKENLLLFKSGIYSVSVSHKSEMKLPINLESMELVDTAYFCSWVRSFSVEHKAFRELYFDTLKEWRLLKIF